MRWLGFDWDEGPEVGGPYGPYRQSERFDIYADVAARLLEAGRAYHCYCSRRGARRAQRRRPAPRAARPGYDGHCRALTDGAARRPTRPRAASRCVRFRMPDHAITFDDLVRGEITFQPENVPDYVLVRANGHPLYTLVNPVDDALMEITHVLRGEDLLSSTPRQIALYDALAEIGVGTGRDPAVRAPALRHGPGQQEAVQARPRGQPARLPRPRLPARGAAQLPGAARLGDRRGPRHLLDGGDGRGVHDRAGQPQPGPLRPQEGRGDQRHPPAGAAASRTSTERMVPYLQAAGVLLERRADAAAARLLDAADAAGARADDHPRRVASTCSASCSSTRRRSSATRPTPPSCSTTTTAAGSSRPRTTRSRRSPTWDDRSDRGGAARRPRRGARAQAAQRLRPGPGRDHRPAGLAAAVRVAGAARPRAVAGPAAPRRRRERTAGAPPDAPAHCRRRSTGLDGLPAYAPQPPARRARAGYRRTPARPSRTPAGPGLPAVGYGACPPVAGAAPGRASRTPSRRPTT